MQEVRRQIVDVLEKNVFSCSRRESKDFLQTSVKVKPASSVEMSSVLSQVTFDICSNKIGEILLDCITAL